MGIIGESNLYMSFSVPFLTFAIIVILTKILHKYSDLKNRAIKKGYEIKNK
jgi:hypothetical protein